MDLKKFYCLLTFAFLLHYSSCNSLVFILNISFISLFSFPFHFSSFISLVFFLNFSCISLVFLLHFSNISLVFLFHFSFLSMSVFLLYLHTSYADIFCNILLFHCILIFLNHRQQNKCYPKGVKLLFRSCTLFQQ